MAIEDFETGSFDEMPPRPEEGDAAAPSPPLTPDAGVDYGVNEGYVDAAGDQVSADGLFDREDALGDPNGTADSGTQTSPFVAAEETLLDDEAADDNGSAANDAGAPGLEAADHEPGPIGPLPIPVHEHGDPSPTREAKAAEEPLEQVDGDDHEAAAASGSAAADVAPPPDERLGDDGSMERPTQSRNARGDGPAEVTGDQAPGHTDAAERPPTGKAATPADGLDDMFAGLKTMLVQAAESPGSEKTDKLYQWAPNQGPIISEAHESLRETEASDAYTVLQRALTLFNESGTFDDSAGISVEAGDSHMHVQVYGVEPEDLYGDKFVLCEVAKDDLPDYAGDGPAKVEILTEQRLQYIDPSSGERLSALLRVGLSYEVPSGKDEPIRLVNLQGSLFDEAGEVREAANQALFGRFSAPDFSQRNGIPGSEAEQAFVLQSARQQADAVYKTFSAKRQPQELEARDEPMTADAAEAEPAAVLPGSGVLEDAEILYGIALRDETSPPSAFYESAANLAEMLSLEHSLDAVEAMGEISETDLAELADGTAEMASDGMLEQAKAKIADIAAFLERSPDAPLAVRARAFFVAKQFGLSEYGEKLQELLYHEQASLAQAANRADFDVSQRDNGEVLSAVVTTCGHLGLDPSDWISRYAHNPEAAWDQQVAHILGLREAGQEVDDQLLDEHAKLVVSEDESGLSPNFVRATIPEVLSQCRPDRLAGAEMRRLLINRFTDLYPEVAPQPDLLYGLLQVGYEALASSGPETLATIDRYVSATSQQLKQDSASGAINEYIDTVEASWKVSYRVHNGDNPAEIKAAIDDEILPQILPGAINDREEARAQAQMTLLQAAAMQYSTQNDLAAVRQLLPHISDVNQLEYLYVSGWRNAQTKAQLMQLNPVDNPTAVAFRPRLIEHFGDAQAVLADDVDDLISTGDKVAKSLQSSDAVQSDPYYERPNPHIQWEQLGRILGRTITTEGLPAALALSRTVVSAFHHVPNAVPDLHRRLSPFYKIIARAGEASDVAMVREIVWDQHDSWHSKLNWLTEFALWRGSPSTAAE